MLPKDPRTPFALASRLSLLFIAVAASTTALPWQNVVVLSGFIFSMCAIAYVLHNNKKN